MFLLTGMPLLTVVLSNTANHNPGKYIEAYSRSRTRDAITSLAKLKPVEALVVALADEKHPVACFRSEDGDLEMGKTDIETEKQISECGSKVQKVPVDLLEISDVVRVPSGSTRQGTAWLSLANHCLTRAR
jgi:cation transport ATPase